MLYILDTNHITLLQNNTPSLIRQLKRVPPTQRVVCIVSVTEQIQGRLANLTRVKSELEATVAFRQLYETIAFYRAQQVLLYSQAAARQFDRLRQQRIRIGTQDLRIAAIALSQQATVVTRNRRDFGQVPGLLIEDWSKE